MNPVIRPATEKDVKEFLGDQKLGSSVYGYSVELDGNVVALATRSLQKNQSVIFSNIKDSNAPKITVYRTALKVLKMLIRKGMPFYAIRNDNIPNAGKFLESLGFYQLGESNVYKYEVLK